MNYYADSGDDSRCCAVCFLPYDLKEHVPRTLVACMHSFCHACVDAMTRADTVTCPVCKIDSKATACKTNFGMRDMVEAKLLSSAARSAVTAWSLTVENADNDETRSLGQVHLTTTLGELKMAMVAFDWKMDAGTLYFNKRTNKLLVGDGNLISYAGFALQAGDTIMIKTPVDHYQGAGRDVKEATIKEKVERVYEKGSKENGKKACIEKKKNYAVVDSNSFGSKGCFTYRMKAGQDVFRHRQLVWKDNAVGNGEFAISTKGLVSAYFSDFEDLYKCALELDEQGK